MRTLDLVFYILAALCFGLSVFPGVPQRVNLIALGLLAWVLVPLLALASAS